MTTQILDNLQNKEELLKLLGEKEKELNRLGIEAMSRLDDRYIVTLEKRVASEIEEIKLKLNKLNEESINK